MVNRTFAGALAQHRALMLQRARSIVKNEADAEDVVQEALERAWRARDTFDLNARPAPWLLKITRNVALDFLRRQKTAEFGLLDEAVAADGAVDEHVVRRESALSIAGAMRSLAPDQRITFVLHDVHGYSSREISNQAAVPYHTVRTHLYRARRRLRSELDGAQS